MRQGIKLSIQSSVPAGGYRHREGFRKLIFTIFSDLGVSVSARSIHRTAAVCLIRGPKGPKRSIRKLYFVVYPIDILLSSRQFGLDVPVSSMSWLATALKNFATPRKISYVFGDCVQVFVCIISEFQMI